MISWIVASHDPKVLDSVLRPSLGLRRDEELIVVTDAPSIATAYNQGTAEAAHRIRCYVQHDVRVLDPDLLRTALVSACGDQGTGMVGVIGSRTAVLPWWEGVPCGSVIDTRAGFGRIDFGPGGHECAYLDGLLLATAQPLAWDTRYEGWHLYDHDACQQMLARGLTNWCLADGAGLVEHHSGNSVADWLADGSWDANVERFTAKWQAV